MKHKTKRIVGIVFWFFFSVSVLSLMSITQKRMKATQITLPSVQIFVDDENSFLTKQELIDRLEQKRLIFSGQHIGELDTEKIEDFIRSMEEVRDVDVYRHLNGSWNVEVQLRKPIARLFTAHNESYFIDSQGDFISSTPQHLARVLVVTGNIPQRKDTQRDTKVINNENLITRDILSNVYRLCFYICNDELFRSMIGQVHVSTSEDFILVPLVGDQKIIFGSAVSDEEVARKFNKLKIFYREALPYEGWNKYSEISLKYDRQIVCRKKE